MWEYSFIRNSKADPINPNHYKNSTSLECIEAMEIIFGAKAVIDFCVCNAWKYIWRWKNKNGFEDLDKAKWYIDKAWDLFDEKLVISEKKRSRTSLNCRKNWDLRRMPIP